MRRRLSCKRQQHPSFDRTDFKLKETGEHTTRIQEVEERIARFWQRFGNCGLCRFLNASADQQPIGFALLVSSIERIRIISKRFGFRIAPFLKC